MVFQNGDWAIISIDGSLQEQNFIYKYFHDLLQYQMMPKIDGSELYN